MYATSPEHANRNLLNTFLALLGVDVARSAKAALMPRDQGSQYFIFTHPADRLVVPFGSPRPRIQFWPVDLRQKLAVFRTAHTGR